MMTRRATRFGIGWMAAAAFVAGAASDCWAQPGGMGIGGSSGGQQRDQGQSDSAQGESGSATGAIVRFMAAGSEDDELIGRLLVRFESGPTRAFVIRRKDDLHFRLGGKEIPPENLDDVLLAGLNVRVGWNTDKSSGKPTAYLTTFEFTELEIEGLFLAYDADQLRIKGRPANNQEWPAPKRTARPRSNRPPRTYSRPPRENAVAPKSRAAPEKTLRIKFIEDVSAVTDDVTRNAILLADLRRNQRIKATIVFGRQMHLLVSASVQGAGNEDEAGDRSGKHDG